MDRGKDGCVDRSIIDGKIERWKDQERQEYSSTDGQLDGSGENVKKGLE